MEVTRYLRVALFAFWKYVRLKRDVYTYTQKLETAIGQMLKQEAFKADIGETDDLWGKIYGRLARLSRLYLHKNAEISKEQEQLRELVSDISHQTKTPITNIRLYLEMMTEEADPDRNREYLAKMGGQVDKLDFLLQSMVKMSRLETGMIKNTETEHPPGRYACCGDQQCGNSGGEETHSDGCAV